MKSRANVLGADPEIRRHITDLCRLVSLTTGKSLQAIHGYLRSVWSSKSIYRIPIAVWPYVRQNLEILGSPMHPQFERVAASLDGAVEHARAERRAAELEHARKRHKRAR